MPDLFSGLRFDGEETIGAGHVHHTAHHDGNPFGSRLARVEGPGPLQPRNVAGVDLLQRREPGGSRVVSEHGPIVLGKEKTGERSARQQDSLGPHGTTSIRGCVFEMGFGGIVRLRGKHAPAASFARWTGLRPILQGSTWYNRRHSSAGPRMAPEFLLNGSPVRAEGFGPQTTLLEFIRARG